MSDSYVLVGFIALGVVFMLVIVLGMQIQISTLVRRIDELTEEVEKR